MTMPLIMRDSISPQDIPADTPVVAGYGDGRWVWSSADWSRFSGVKLSIVVFPQHSGDILDVELGDATPADVPGWLDRFQRMGRRRGTVYCSRDTIAAVRAAAGPRAFDWWAATLDGTQDVPGAVAVQYAGSALTGAAYDESVIVDPTWVEGGTMTLDASDPIVAALLADTANARDAANRILGLLSHGQQYDEAGNPIPGTPQFVPDELTALAAALATLQTGVTQLGVAVANLSPSPAIGTLTQGQAQQLQDIHDAVGRLETALKGA